MKPQRFSKKAKQLLSQYYTPELIRLAEEAPLLSEPPCPHCFQGCSCEECLTRRAEEAGLLRKEEA